MWGGLIPVLLFIRRGRRVDDVRGCPGRSAGTAVTFIRVGATRGVGAVILVEGREVHVADIRECAEVIIEVGIRAVEFLSTHNAKLVQEL
jgi:hypothetical protein